MHFDVAIIGAGLSGIAAGIRSAYFGKRVCILERHYAYGGLNSYYTLAGRKYDVGLHALTNFVPPDQRQAPLNKLLRQLRLNREVLDLCEQGHSEIRFPGRTLRFSNDRSVLESEVAREFPGCIDAYRGMVAFMDAYDDVRLDAKYESARARLRDFLGDPVLIDMLLCGAMFYGCPQPHDMDFTHFVTIFKAIYLEGFARPRAGVRPLMTALVKQFRANGGKLRMRCGVDSLEVKGGRVAELGLSDGTSITADKVLSCAGYVETMGLCHGIDTRGIENGIGQISFVECMMSTSVLPQDLGHSATIVFFNDAETFDYSPPAEDVDTRSGVLCCPSNYDGHGTMPEGMLRLTWLANPHRWEGYGEDAYRASKAACHERFLAASESFVPGICGHVTATDMFTPRTIRRFTGHINGSVYGSSRKHRDGKTPIENLYICGTDQGYLGIIGAMLSGITIANAYVLDE